MAQIIEVNQATFEEDVIRRSLDVPVVVDFWAPWCGPCRVLGPVLEKLCREMDGQFVLAKVNTDENQRLAVQYGVRGIPAVKAFVNGKVVSEFVGAQPEPTVRRWLMGFVPSEADRLLAQAEKDESRAEELARKALELDPRHAGASVLLAKVLAARGETDEARKLIGGLETADDPDLEQELARLRLKLNTSNANIAELLSRVQEAPDDMDSRYELAMALVAQAKYQEALAHLLEVVAKDHKQKREQARKVMLDIFEALGPQSPLVEDYRTKLANLLYS